MGCGWLLNQRVFKIHQCLTLLILVLLGLGACNRDTSHKVRLHVYPDSTGKNTLFVNDQPIETYQKERGSGPVYAEIYEPYYLVKSPEPRFRLAIKREGAPVYESTIEPGKYVINVSSHEEMWFVEIAYGRQLRGEAQFLDRGKLGVYRLGKQSVGGVVFKFDQEPPESVRTPRGSTDTEYFILGTFTEKGIALRKTLAGLGSK